MRWKFVVSIFWKWKTMKRTMTKGVYWPGDQPEQVLWLRQLRQPNLGPGGDHQHHPCHHQLHQNHPPNQHCQYHQHYLASSLSLSLLLELCSGMWSNNLFVILIDIATIFNTISLFVVMLSPKCPSPHSIPYHQYQKYEIWAILLRKGIPKSEH